MRLFVFRDSAIVIVTMGLFILSPENMALQICLGVGLGLSAYLFHEWAHWLGARLVNAKIDSPDFILSPFLFSFDSEANSTRQFVHMTWPGFLATAIYITAYDLLLPDTLWGQIAWWMAVALTLATVIIEGPLALWAVLREDLPPVEIPFLGENRVLNQLFDRVQGGS
ncbi:MAG: hypothetical protein JJ957_18220 [Pseudomonadales bacterium]|nr:hypothetical protein [Pseudomonadales bacterium]MBO6597886.1 hypothetical protein [Pseudomonadales bacterium]MBO6824294.1 hypothetical protein [Pseudomonadales bacterium]